MHRKEKQGPESDQPVLAGKDYTDRTAFNRLRDLVDQIPDFRSPAQLENLSALVALSCKATTNSSHRL